MPIPHDPILRSLLPLFCSEWELDLGERWWAGVYARRDSTDARRLVHTLRGSFLQYGVDHGLPLVEALGEAVRTGDWDVAQDVVTALSALVVDLRASLDVP